MNNNYSYDRELVGVAKQLADNSGFAALIREHMTNLKNAVTDSDEEKEILNAHSELAAFRNFIEYLQILAEQP